MLTYEDAYGFYCHAGITPGKAPQVADEEVYLWGSGGFFSVPLLPYPRPIVCGHYELREPLVTRARICLDTAAYRSGVLTALQMETRTLVQVSHATP